MVGPYYWQYENMVAPYCRVFHVIWRLHIVVAEQALTKGSALSLVTHALPSGDSFLLMLIRRYLLLLQASCIKWRRELADELNYHFQNEVGVTVDFSLLRGFP
jgi:hypothetical protein